MIIVILIFGLILEMSSALVFIPFLSRLPTWRLLMNLVPSMKCWRFKLRHKINDALSPPHPRLCIYRRNPTLFSIVTERVQITNYRVWFIEGQTQCKSEILLVLIFDTVKPVFNGQLPRSRKSPVVAQSMELVELKGFLELSYKMQVTTCEWPVRIGFTK